MTAIEIYDHLLYLHGNHQWSFVPVRRTIEQVNEGNVEEFWDIVYTGVDIPGQQLVDDMARIGLCPMLANGEEHPLTLTEAGNEYKYPDRANAFLALMSGSKNAWAAVVSDEDAELAELELTTRPDLV